MLTRYCLFALLLLSPLAMAAIVPPFTPYLFQGESNIPPSAAEFPADQYPGGWLDKAATEARALYYRTDNNCDEVAAYIQATTAGHIRTRQVEINPYRGQPRALLISWAGISIEQRRMHLVVESEDGMCADNGLIGHGAVFPCSELERHGEIVRRSAWQ